VIGSFGVDFVVVPGVAPKIYMSEINLRMGGTSHPFYMARFVTGGVYTEETGDLVVDGRPKFYVATDNIKHTELIGTKPSQVIEAAEVAGLGYDRATGTGVTFHLLGALQGYGKLGCVAIGDSRAQAESYYEEIGQVLERLARS
jgi:hypothetical protein